MNYRVLYRKYRPTDFDSIVGQDYTIKTLRNSIVNNSISHAYIFSGPRGTGKTSTAKIFAKAINCLNPIDGSPCGKCSFCVNFNENPDIIEMDAASNNGVDEIREIIDNVKIAPTNGKYKIYIIDEVHMLTTSAFNALLLTLEEPPSHVVFILATTNIESVPITILSRCQRFDFQKIKEDKLVENLKGVAEKENIKVTEEALLEIAYLAEGGMRDALSILDQLSKNKETITLELIEKEIKTISTKSINDLIDSIENNDISNFLNMVEDFKTRAVDYKSLIKKIIDNISSRAKKIKNSGLVTRLSFQDYKNLILELTEAFTKININVNPYTIIEMIMLDYFETQTKKVNKVTKLVSEEKESSKEIVDKKIESKEENDWVKIRINNCFVNAQKKYLNEGKEMIDNLLKDNKIKGKAKALLIDANLVVASDEYLIFSCLNEHQANNANELCKKIDDILGKKTAFISEEEWNREKEEYIKNIKNGKKYELIKEKEEEKVPVLTEVFDVNKVEIV